MTTDPLRAALAEALADVHKPDWHPGMLWTDVYEQWADRILAHPAVLAALDKSEPAGLRENDCEHADERGSTVMETSIPHRYECAVCGQRFTLTPYPALAATPTASPTATGQTYRHFHPDGTVSITTRRYDGDTNHDPLTCPDCRPSRDAASPTATGEDSP